MTDTNKTPSEHLQIIQRTLQVAAGTIELLSMAVRARSGGHEAATKDALENIDQQALSSLDALEKVFIEPKLPDKVDVHGALAELIFHVSDVTWAEALMLSADRMHLLESQPPKAKE